MSLKGRQNKPKFVRIKGKPGRVVGTMGRRVVVRDDEGERVCYLSGQRAVVGDLVRWEDAEGSGGKLVGVESRSSSLWRRDIRGKERLLAANLRGIVVVTSPSKPDFDPMLVDRYLVAANAEGLIAAICLNKNDLGVSSEVLDYLNNRDSLGYPVFRVSVKEPTSLAPLENFISKHTSNGEGPLALVGRSGVGKTSLISVLLPELNVGPIGELSEYWEQGQHTTTGSRLFTLPIGGELVDSPGIRSFSPAGLTEREVRNYFPGIVNLQCQFRDCLHEIGQKGCVIEQTCDAVAIKAYRRLLEYIRGQKQY